MAYTVKFKKSNGFFWRKLKGVKGDGLVEGYNSRYFILESEERIELPLSYEFKFCRERFETIRRNIELEAGQKIPVREG